MDYIEELYTHLSGALLSPQLNDKLATAEFEKIRSVMLFFGEYNMIAIPCVMVEINDFTPSRNSNSTDTGSLNFKLHIIMHSLAGNSAKDTEINKTLSLNLMRFNLYLNKYLIDVFKSRQNEINLFTLPKRIRVGKVEQVDTGKYLQIIDYETTVTDYLLNQSVTAQYEHWDSVHIDKPL